MSNVCLYCKFVIISRAPSWPHKTRHDLVDFVGQITKSCKEIDQQTSIVHVYIVLFKFRRTTKGKTWDYQLDLSLIYFLLYLFGKKNNACV